MNKRDRERQRETKEQRDRQRGRDTTYKILLHMRKHAQHMWLYELPNDQFPFMGLSFPKELFCSVLSERETERGRETETQAKREKNMHART